MAAAFLLGGACYPEAFVVLVDTDFDVTENSYLSVTTLENDTDYTSILAELEERYEYWKSVDVTIDDEEFEPGSFTVWKEAGCIMPLDGDYNEDEKEIIEVGTPREDAPNLVFILLDDVGLNDLTFGGAESTWIPFATPNLDKLSADGIVLTNHYSCWVCAPTRAALLSGQYPYRNGYGNTPANGEVNLPTSVTTLPEELKPLGYRSAIIGKWHLGMKTWAHTPTFRGFDTFYGYYMGAVGYFDKYAESGHLDLHTNERCVVNEAELSEDAHLTTLLQVKAEAVIYEHALEYSDSRLFLYYAPETMHTGPFIDYEAPDEYLAMCSGNSSYYQAYCALIMMMDEAIGNTVCALEDTGLYNNTLMVVVSDNGGYKGIPGTSYPYRGLKGSFWAGGTKTTALVLGSDSMIPSGARGTSYNGLIHISDWFVSFLKLADPEWKSSVEMDGVDNYRAIITNSSSNRTELFMNYNNVSNTGAMQIRSFRYLQVNSYVRVIEPTEVLEAGDGAEETVSCSDFSFADDDMAVFHDDDFGAVFDDDDDNDNDVDDANRGDIAPSPADGDPPPGP